MNIYKRLGIDSRADERTIKRAYAALIKQYRPETHPQEFADIRDAYEQALYYCRQNQQDPEEAQAVQEIVPEQVLNTSLQETVASETSVIPENDEELAQSQVENEEPESREPHPISVMMNELDALEAHAGEQEILAVYLRQQEQVATLPIDEQMDYEHALKHYLLYSSRPPLLVFLQANRRYGWHEHSMEIVNYYGPNAGSRFYAIKALAENYASMLESKNPYLAEKDQPLPRLPLISSHYLQRQAEGLLQKWRVHSNEAVLSGVGERIFLHARKVQVYWLDVAIGLFFMWVDWMESTALGKEWPLIEALGTGVFFALIPAAIRWLFWGLKNPLEKFKQRFAQARAHWQAALPALLILVGVLLVAAFLLAVVVNKQPGEGMIILVGLVVGGGIMIFMLNIFYAALSSLEVMLTSFGYGLISYLRRLKPGHKTDKNQSGLRWDTEIRQWFQSTRERWRSVRSSAYLWFVIWFVVLQLVTILSRK